MKKNKPTDQLTVKVKPFSYQPKKSELKEKIHIDSTPEQLAYILMQPARIEKSEN